MNMPPLKNPPAATQTNRSKVHGRMSRRQTYRSVPTCSVALCCLWIHTNAKATLLHSNMHHCTASFVPSSMSHEHRGRTSPTKPPHKTGHTLPVPAAMYTEAWLSVLGAAGPPRLLLLQQCTSRCRRCGVMQPCHAVCVTYRALASRQSLHGANIRRNQRQWPHSALVQEHKSNDCVVDDKRHPCAQTAAAIQGVSAQF